MNLRTGFKTDIFSQLAGEWAGSVDLYHASLDLPDDILASLAETLSPEERARAARLRSTALGRHFRAGRAILRQILAGYLDCTPEAVVFGYGARGKPKLASQDARLQPGSLQAAEPVQTSIAEMQTPDIRFNVAHSAGQIVCAVTLGREIGVDIEQARMVRDLEAVARRYFSPLERQMLFALPEAQWLAGFFNCWTRKEAYIKARGEGFAIPFDSFTVSVGESAKLLLLPTGDTTRWALHAFIPETGFVAALVVEEG